MARHRSPNYPRFTLEESINSIKKIYLKDYTLPIGREVVAKHLGYSGLSGRALSKIGALKAYALLEGRGDELRVSDLAVRLIEGVVGSVDMAEATRAAAESPQIFQEISSRYSSQSSDEAIRLHLTRNAGVLPSAADRVIHVYRDASRLVEEISSGLERASEGGSSDSLIQFKARNWSDSEKETDSGEVGESSAYISPDGSTNADLRNNRLDVFSLDEGTVTLNWPENISLESYEDMKSWLDLVLRKAKRQAEASEVD